MVKPNDLIIPVYLNQRIVFDLIAMMKGGISTVTRVVSTESLADTDQRRYGADFGLSKALSTLLKINFSGQRDVKKEEGKQVKFDQEKVHTPSSLFHNLRNMLRDEHLLLIVDDSFIPEPHQLIEFTTSLRRNPLIQTIDSFVSIGEMAAVFDFGSEPKKGKKQDIDANKKQVAQFREFSKKLKADTVDIITDSLRCGYRAVITLETEYLNDPTMSDLVEGRFNVLGKIIRVIREEEDGSINLIRKTSLSFIPEEQQNGFFRIFQNMSEQGGYRIPKMEWEIMGPVIQIIPVAIFA